MRIAHHLVMTAPSLSTAASPRLGQTGLTPRLREMGGVHGNGHPASHRCYAYTCIDVCVNTDMCIEIYVVSPIICARLAVCTAMCILRHIGVICIYMYRCMCIYIYVYRDTCGLAPHLREIGGGQPCVTYV